MNKIDVLHSYLVERMSGVIREILEEVKATVKDYQEENTNLKQQLRDALSRTETDLHGQVHRVSPTACEFGSPQKSEENQQVPTHALSQHSSSERMPCSQDVTSICKTETEGREFVHLKESSLNVSLPSEDDQTFVPDERWNVSLETNRIKTEPDDTIITVTSLVTTTPVHAGQCQDSQVTHQLRATCDASSTSKKAQRKEIHSTRHLRPRKDSLKTSETHRHEGPYKCSRCGRQLKDFRKLQQHKRLHERSFSCHWCGRNFSKFDYLQVHERTHTGERPYRCNWCSKTFSQNGNMRRHERLHMGQGATETTTTTVDTVEESKPLFSL